MKNSKTKFKRGLFVTVLFFAILAGTGILWKALFWFDLRLDANVTELCEEFDVDKSMIYALIKAESNFNEAAVSSKGAVGLMQLMPPTAAFAAKELGLETFSIHDKKQNLRLGVFYFSYLRQRFSDDAAAVAAYNAGETVVARWLQDPSLSDDGKMLKSIPYAETQNHVKKVARYQKIYTSLYK